MYFRGVIIGLAAFLIIGVFHPLVIKGEFQFGKRIWPVFLVAGVALIAVSLFINNLTVSAIVGITAFTCLWSIRELYEQEERVRKGWFPANPDRVQKDS